MTGFPRSGTSTMMRMLAFGGLEVVADKDMVEPEEGLLLNPYGTYEMHDMRVLHEDPEMRASVLGRAIKVVCPYVERFPFIIDADYKAIFVLRDRTEIISSLLAARTVWEYDIDEALQNAQLILRDQNIPILFVQYKEMVQYPRTTAMRIVDFLEADLDLDKMVEAVDAGARRKLLKTDRPDNKLVTFNPDDYLDRIQLGSVLDEDGDEVIMVKNPETGEYESLKEVEKKEQEEANARTEHS